MRRIPTVARSLLLPFLAGLAACAIDTDGLAGGEGGSGGGGGEPGYPLRGGPLAHAGADLRVLEGMPVRLDGRASIRGELGLPLRFLWTQEAGPRVVLDDPTSREPWFVAPPIDPEQESRLVFLLTVDDGVSTSRDRVVVDLVAHPDEMESAPVAVSGPDRVVKPGSPVLLDAPTTLDLACLQTGGEAGCEEAPLLWRYTQVDGPPVQLDGRRFVAPAAATVLTFRLDAHRPGGEAGDRTASCGPEGDLPPDGLLCSAPDYVRIVVDDDLEDDPPYVIDTVVQHATFSRGEHLHFVQAPQAGGYVTNVVAHTTGDDPNGDFYRTDTFPLVGFVDGGPMGNGWSFSVDWRGPDGDTWLGWPRIAGVAFEYRAARLRSRPALAVVVWEPPSGASLPVAVAGPDTCADPSDCRPVVSGETVVLDGSGSFVPGDAGPPASELFYCWRQTSGPEVSFEEGAGCLQGVPYRTFVAPEAPTEGGPLVLTFYLQVHDGTAADERRMASKPDTVVVRVFPADAAR